MGGLRATHRITFASIFSGERYTGFVLKENDGRYKIGRTAGRTVWGRLQNWLCGYWWSEDNMSHVELSATDRGVWREGGG